MSELVPCSACSRHVRSTEAACPFCRASFDPPTARAPDELRSPVRLSRAALALAGMAALSACGKSLEAPAYGGPPPLVNTDEPRAVYGGPPVMMDAEPPPAAPRAGDAGTDAGSDAGKTPAPKPTPSIVHPPAPAYGGPPPKH